MISIKFLDRIILLQRLISDILDNLIYLILTITNNRLNQKPFFEKIGHFFTHKIS